MRLDELSKSWQAAAAQRVTAEISFDGDLLVLGAQTHLAKVGPALDKSRLSALLAAAHGRSIAAASLRHIQRALENKRNGDLIVALIHLALSGVAKPRHPKEDARRLFIADALMRQGVDPAVVAKGMLSLADGAPDKYAPDQPRVPAGNPDGGQWTAGDSAGAATSPRPQQPRGIQVADASSTRGHEVMSDATPQHNGFPIVDAAYQGKYHDFLRDQFTDQLRKAGNTVITEVPLTVPGDPPITAKIDILFRTTEGDVYGIEVKTGDDPSFTSAQRIVYPHVEIGTIVVSTDPRIAALAMTPGVALDRIEIVVMKTAGPGAPIQFVPLYRSMSE